MFTLSLEHFRGWKNIKVSFPENKVTLIHGPSGIGKTTLFEAIEWMLYGKLRGVEPLLGNGSPMVMLDAPKWTIQRLSSSNVRFYDKETDTYYVDSDAQRYIEYKFQGPKVWKPCCYIKQKKFNSFLEGTNADKMSFLNSLAFHGEDPSVFYAKLDAKIQLLKQESQQAQDQFNYANGRYSAMPPGVECVDAVQKEARWRQLGSLIPESERSNLMQARLDERKSTLQRQLLEVQHQQSLILQQLRNHVIPSVPEFDLVSCEKNITSFLRYEKLQQELRLLPAPTTYDDVVLPTTYEAKELEAVCRLEEQIAQTKQVLSRFSVAYDATLPAYLQKCQAFLEGEEENKKKHQVTNAIATKKSELASLSLPSTPVAVTEPLPPTPIDTSQQEEEKAILQRRSEELRQTLGKNFLRCPHCDKTSHYLNGALLSSDNVDLPALREEQKNVSQRLAILLQDIQHKQQRYHQELQAYTRNLQVYTLYLQQQQRYIEEKARQEQRRQILEQELLTLVPPDNIQPLDKYAKVRALYQAIRDLTYRENPPVSSKQMQEVMRRYQDAVRQQQEVMRKRQEEERRNVTRTRLQEELASFSSPPTDERELLQAHRFREEQRRRAEETKNAFEKKHEMYVSSAQKLQQEIDGIVVPPLVDIAPLRQEVQYLQQELQNHHNFLQKKESYNATEPLYRRQEQLLQQLQRQYRLRQVMSDVECLNLQDKVVNTVNDAVSKVCGPIFKESIHVELRLFKDLKNGTKPGVNFLVSYKGGQLNDLERLSGGEKDRASLALSLAFNSRSSFPLLLLDECFASLNDELKEATVESLRAQLNTTMLVIMHDGVQGIYDHDINLADYA